MVAGDGMTDGNASFLRAARAGNLEKVIEYLKGSIDINTSNAQNGLNALHLASKEGHVHVVTELLKRGANGNAATKKGNTALHIASLAGQEEVVKILVQNGANVNVQSQNGFTPLYMAAQENHDSVVRYLLSNGANQSLATEDGFTPLAVALQQGHDKVVAVLLENDTKGRVRLPALHIAAKKDDCKAAALLLQNDHNPDVTSKSGFTPLHIAAHYGNENIANLLLDKGADVNYAAKHQITPLHVASKWGKANMVTLLLDRRAKIEASTRDGLTPLHCAARSGHDQVVDLLLEKGAPIVAKTKNGLAPLHMASQGDHVDSARILLYHKAPVDDVTVDYLTALHVAAHCGHVRVAKLLLDRKADPNARALNGFTPLHIACKKNRIKVVELLLKHGASIEATTESGLTPLHVASFMGCMNIVIFLIQHGASPDVPTVRGETPLHLAARANQTDIIRILLRNGAHVDAHAREDQTPLHIASRLGNVDIVSLLLQHGAAVDATTKDMYTPLHIAAKEGQEEVASVLLDHGASLTSTTKKGFTPLHLAAKYGNIKVARLLLQKDAPVDAQGKNGVTPLHVAAHYDHVNVALLLLEKGASPHAMAKNGYTPLHIAAKKNQMDIATTLLEYGAKPDAESKAGFTPLHLGSQEGHTDVTTLLIEHSANVNAKAKNGLTPLHLCSQEDHVKVAAILVKSGAEIGPQTKAGYTPLHVASHFGQINMVRFLLQHAADVNMTTSHGYTPLHQAAQQGHTLIINLLLDHKASPNVTTTQGQTALSIAQRLGYISVVETLKVVTETIVTTTTTTVTEEKYKVVAPETMQETFMTDSEDEGGEDIMLGEQSYRYLTADEMKFLGDDSLPIDVTRDEKNPDAISLHKDFAAPLIVEEEQLSPQHISQLESSFSEKYSPDNVDISHAPVHAGSFNWADDFFIFPIPSKGMLRSRFLVSFMVDARGGAMRGCRHSGVRVIIPPRKAPMPMRITCRYLRKEKLIHPPPLMEGEACASRILEVGPVNARFLGPVIIEVPHFASLRGKEREITILRSDNGENWREHTLEASEEAVQEVLNESFEGEEFTALEDLNTNRITRILTTDFPQYFALITRVRQEVHAVGPEGGMVSSTVVPQVQAIFPEGALTKKIKVGLQAQPISPELVAKLLGNRVAVSPIVTVEPRRRKFHKPITLTIPVPQAATKGMINQYSGDAPTLRLLCSITGGTTKAQWEDVTGSTPLTFVNECVSFTTTVSARFWLMDCRQVNEATKFATELYQEAIHVPFMAKFVVFAKRHEPMEAQLRVFCMTDDKEDKTLESQEHFTEVAKSRDIEVLEGKLQYLEFAGNLIPVTKSGEQLKLTFQAFRENRLPFIIRVKDLHQEPMGRIAFMREPRVGRGEPPQTPICNLNVALPEVCPISEVTVQLSELVTLERKYGFVQESGLAKPELIHRADLRLSDIARELDKDWVALALQLDISEADIMSMKAECPEDTNEQALIMLRMWMQRTGPRATGNELEKALRKIGREDIVNSCMFNVELVTDDVEKAVAKVHLDQSGFDVFKEELGSSRETSIRRGPSLDVSYDEQDIMKEAESAAETSSETGSVFEKEPQQLIMQERETYPLHTEKKTEELCYLNGTLEEKTKYIVNNQPYEELSNQIKKEEEREYKFEKPSEIEAVEKHNESSPFVIENKEIYYDALPDKTYFNVFSLDTTFTEKESTNTQTIEETVENEKNIFCKVPSEVEEKGFSLETEQNNYQQKNENNLSNFEIIKENSDQVNPFIYKEKSELYEGNERGIELASASENKEISLKTLFKQCTSEITKETPETQLPLTHKEETNPISLLMLTSKSATEENDQHIEPECLASHVVTKCTSEVSSVQPVSNELIQNISTLQSEHPHVNEDEISQIKAVMCGTPENSIQTEQKFKGLMTFEIEEKGQNMTRSQLYDIETISPDDKFEQSLMFPLNDNALLLESLSSMKHDSESINSDKAVQMEEGIFKMVNIVESELPVYPALNKISQNENDTSVPLEEKNFMEVGIEKLDSSLSELVKNTVKEEKLEYTFPVVDKKSAVEVLNTAEMNTETKNGNVDSVLFDKSVVNLLSETDHPIPSDVENKNCEVNQVQKITCESDMKCTVSLKNELDSVADIIKINTSDIKPVQSPISSQFLYPLACESKEHNIEQENSLLYKLEESEPKIHKKQTLFEVANIPSEIKISATKLDDETFDARQKDAILQKLATNDKSVSMPTEINNGVLELEDSDSLVYDTHASDMCDVTLSVTNELEEIPSEMKKIQSFEGHREKISEIDKMFPLMPSTNQTDSESSVVESVNDAILPEVNDVYLESKTAFKISEPNRDNSFPTSRMTESVCNVTLLQDTISEFEISTSECNQLQSTRTDSCSASTGIESIGNATTEQEKQPITDNKLISIIENIQEFEQPHPGKEEATQKNQHKLEDRFEVKIMKPEEFIKENYSSGLKAYEMHNSQNLENLEEKSFLDINNKSEDTFPVLTEKTMESHEHGLATSKGLVKSDGQTSESQIQFNRCHTLNEDFRLISEVTHSPPVLEEKSVEANISHDIALILQLNDNKVQDYLVSSEQGVKSQALSNNIDVLEQERLHCDLITYNESEVRSPVIEEVAVLNSPEQNLKENDLHMPLLPFEESNKGSYISVTQPTINEIEQTKDIKHSDSIKSDYEKSMYNSQPSSLQAFEYEEIVPASKPLQQVAIEKGNKCEANQMLFSSFKIDKDVDSETFKILSSSCTNDNSQNILGSHTLTVDVNDKDGVTDETKLTALDKMKAEVHSIYHDANENESNEKFKIPSTSEKTNVYDEQSSSSEYYLKGPYFNTVDIKQQNLCESFHCTNMYADNEQNAGEKNNVVSEVELKEVDNIPKQRDTMQLNSCALQEYLKLTEPYEVLNDTGNEIKILQNETQEDAANVSKLSQTLSLQSGNKTLQNSFKIVSDDTENKVFEKSEVYEETIIPENIYPSFSDSKATILNKKPLLQKIAEVLQHNACTDFPVAKKCESGADPHKSAEGKPMKPTKTPPPSPEESEGKENLKAVKEAEEKPVQKEQVTTAIETKELIDDGIARRTVTTVTKTTVVQETEEIPQEPREQAKLTESETWLSGEMDTSQVSVSSLPDDEKSEPTTATVSSATAEPEVAPFIEQEVTEVCADEKEWSATGEEGSTHHIIHRTTHVALTVKQKSDETPEGGVPGIPQTLSSEHVEYDEKISSISSASSDLALREDSDKDITSQEHVQPEQQSEATDTEEQFSPSPPKETSSLQTSVQTVSPLPRPSPPEPSSFVVESEISPATEYPSQLTPAMQVHVGLSPTELQIPHYSQENDMKGAVEFSEIIDSDIYPDEEKEVSVEAQKVESKLCYEGTIATEAVADSVTTSTMSACASQDLEVQGFQSLALSGMAFDNSAFVGAEVIDATDSALHNRAISPYEVVRKDKEVDETVKSASILESSKECVSHFIAQEKILKKIEELEGDKETGIPDEEEIFYFEPETIHDSLVENSSKTFYATQETSILESRSTERTSQVEANEGMPSLSSETCSQSETKGRRNIDDKHEVTDEDSFLIRKEEATKIAHEIIKEIKTEVAKRPPLQHIPSEISEEDLVEKGEHSPREQEIQHGIEREELEVRRQSCFDMEGNLIKQKYHPYAQDVEDHEEKKKMIEDITQEEKDSDTDDSHYYDKKLSRDDDSNDSKKDITTVFESTPHTSDLSKVGKSADMEAESYKLIITEHKEDYQKEEILKSKNGESSSGETETIYQSFETSESGKTPQGTPETSRPCSSEFEVNVSMHPSSEYETCLTSHDGSGEVSFATAVTSHDGSYASVRSPISQSSKESAFSIDSESSGHLASIESGMSETLMPSAQEIDVGREAETPTIEETVTSHFSIKEPYETDIPHKVIRGEDAISPKTQNEKVYIENKVSKSNLCEVLPSHHKQYPGTSTGPFDVMSKTELCYSYSGALKGSMDSEGTVEAISDSSEVEKTVIEESFLGPSVSSDDCLEPDKLDSKNLSKQHEECKIEKTVDSAGFSHDTQICIPDFSSAESDHSWNLSNIDSPVAIQHEEITCHAETSIPSTDTCYSSISTTLTSPVVHSATTVISDSYHPTPQYSGNESNYSQINGPVEVDFIPEYDMPYDDMEHILTPISHLESQEAQRVTSRVERSEHDACGSLSHVSSEIGFDTVETEGVSVYTKDKTKMPPSDALKEVIGMEEELDLESLTEDNLCGKEMPKLDSTLVESDMGAVGGLDQKPYIYVKEESIIKEFHTTTISEVQKDPSETLDLDLDVDGVQYYRSVSEDTVDAEIGKILSSESQVEDDIIERPQTPEPPEDVQLQEEPDFLPESDQDIYKDKSEPTSSLRLSTEITDCHSEVEKETTEKIVDNVPYTHPSISSAIKETKLTSHFAFSDDEKSKETDLPSSSDLTKSIEEQQASLELLEKEDGMDTSPEDSRYESDKQDESYKAKMNKDASASLQIHKEQLEPKKVKTTLQDSAFDHDIREFPAKYDCNLPDTYAYNMQFEREFDDQQEEAMDLGSDQYTEDKEEIEDSDKQTTYNYGMRFEIDHEFDDDDIPGYGDLYTHHEEEEETFEEGEREKDCSQTSTAKVENKQSLPDYDTLAGRKFFSKSGEHDDASVSSLQEFERLEEEIAMGRKSSAGSVDSLNGKQFHSKSGDHDDVSMNSLTEFERLERECAEAERVEAIAKEAAARLSEIDEGHESQASEASQETISDNGHESNDSDDYEKRLSEIDEIIRQAQTNVEKFQGQQTGSASTVSHALKHHEGAISSGDSTTSSRIDKTPSPKKDPDTDSLDDIKVCDKITSCVKEESTQDNSVHEEEIASHHFKVEMQASSMSHFTSTYHGIQKDIDQDSLHEDLDISVEHDSLHGDDKMQFHDSLHEDKSGELDSLQEDIRGEMQDSLHEVKGLDEDSLHEMDLLPDESSLSVDSSLAATADTSQSISKLGYMQKNDIAQGPILHDLESELAKEEIADPPVEFCITGKETDTENLELGKGDCMISSTDSLEPSSSTATHATYQFETDSVMSSSLNSVQTSEDYTMVSSTDTLDPESRITYIYGDASLGDFQVLTRDQEKTLLDSEGNIQMHQHVKIYTDSEGNIQRTVIQPVKDVDDMGNKVTSVRPLTSEILSVKTGTLSKKVPANVIFQASPEHREKTLEMQSNVTGIEPTFKQLSYSEEVSENFSDIPFPDNVEIEEIRTTDDKGNPKIIRQIKRTVHSHAFTSPSSSENVEEKFKEFLKKSVPGSSAQEEETKEEKTFDEKGNVVILRTIKRHVTSEPEVHSKSFTGPDAEKQSKEFINEFEKYKLSEDTDHFETTDIDGNIVHVTQQVTVQPEVHTLSFSGPDAQKQMEEYMKHWSEGKKEEPVYYDSYRQYHQTLPQSSVKTDPFVYDASSTTRTTSASYQDTSSVISIPSQRDSVVSSSHSFHVQPAAIISGVQHMESDGEYFARAALAAEDTHNNDIVASTSTTSTLTRVVSSVSSMLPDDDHPAVGSETVCESEEMRNSLRESMQQVLDQFMVDEGQQDYKLEHRKE